MDETQASEQTLVPVREQTVDFYGDSIQAAQTQDTTIWVPLRPLCGYLGLSWVGQRERIMRNTVLAEALRSVRVTGTFRACNTRGTS